MNVYVKSRFTQCEMSQANQKIELCNAPVIHKFFNLFGLMLVLRWLGLRHSGHHNEFWVVYGRAVIFSFEQGLKAGCYWLPESFSTTDFFGGKKGNRRYFNYKNTLFLSYCFVLAFKNLKIEIEISSHFKYSVIFGVQGFIIIAFRIILVI